jgi:prepilin-type N-terminal cleavage/methylation domain-containing protein
MKRAFTLIELLIVVAIIAILAAIAVPNFLEAQVRAKVSRVKADMRSLATALEAYRTDENRYPLDGGINTSWQLFVLTTPVAYLTDIRGIVDPFGPAYDFGPPLGVIQIPFAYLNYDKYSPWAQGEHSWLTAYQQWGYHAAWGLMSWGPGRTYIQGEYFPIYRATPGPLAMQSYNMLYDPTNGTVSLGYLMRFGGDVPYTIPQ